MRIVQGDKGRKAGGSRTETDEDQEYSADEASEEDEEVKVPSKRRAKAPTRRQRAAARSNPRQVPPTPRLLVCLCVACTLLARSVRGHITHALLHTSVTELLHQRIMCLGHQ